MKMYVRFATIAIGVILGGCTPAKINVIKPPGSDSFRPKNMAMMPGGGFMSDAIGIELAGYGLPIVHADVVSSLAIRDNLEEIELSQPKNMKLLADEGIDAVIIVKSIAGYDDKPQSATVKIVRTGNGVMLAGVNWQNGKGGAKGSPADNDARKDMVDASRQIAASLAIALGYSLPDVSYDKEKPYKRRGGPP